VQKEIFEQTLYDMPGGEGSKQGVPRKSEPFRYKLQFESLLNKEEMQQAQEELTEELEEKESKLSILVNRSQLASAAAAARQYADIEARKNKRQGGCVLRMWALVFISSFLSKSFTYPALTLPHFHQSSILLYTTRTTNVRIIKSEEFNAKNADTQMTAWKAGRLTLM